MGVWHIDPRVEAALVNLNDNLCTFERATGREYTLILIPHAPDEEIHVSQSGKPLSPDADMGPVEMLGFALKRRGRG